MEVEDGGDREQLDECEKEFFSLQENSKVLHDVESDDLEQMEPNQTQ